jgi:hypothetical protein
MSANTISVATNVDTSVANNLPSFDGNILRFNQITIVTLTLLALLLGQWPILAFTAIVMLAGSGQPALALFKRLYSQVLRPLGRIKPDWQQDDPRPHNFAQSLGGVVLALAALASALGATLLGLVLGGLVVALALLNLLAGVCVGCFLYFQLRQLQYRLGRRSSAH